MPQNYSCTNAGTGTVNTCAVVYDKDADFGHIDVIEPTLSESKDVGNTVEQLPSQKIPPEALAHLSKKKQKQLLANTHNAFQMLLGIQKKLNIVYL